MLNIYFQQDKADMDWLLLASHYACDRGREWLSMSELAMCSTQIQALSCQSTSRAEMAIFLYEMQLFLSI